MNSATPAQNLTTETTTQDVKNVAAPMAASELTPTMVAQYLANNTDFFVKNPTLLSHMKLPTTSPEGVTDFFAFQADRLKQQLLQVQKRNKLLVQTSIDNMQSQEQIHTLVLDILGAKSMRHLLKIMRTRLADEMNVDYTHMCLLKDSPLPEKVKEACTLVDTETFEKLFEGENDCVALRTLYNDEQKALHDDWAEHAASDALLKITTAEGEPLGALALVSGESDRFHVGQGNDLLVFIGKIISHLMDHWTVEPTTSK